MLILNSINTNAGEVPSVKEYKEHRDSTKYDQFIYGLDTVSYTHLTLPTNREV